MLAAARGEAYHIPFGGRSQFDYAPDVARMLVAASRSDYAGALVANVPSPSVSMREVVDAIVAASPESEGAITFDDVQLPFPAEIEAVALEAALGPLAATPLERGVAETVEHFRTV
jgi:nucleoside-diphosphate-sugar epimerase